MARDIRKEGLDSVSEDEVLSTGQVIKLTGVSEGAIRKYEAKGLLSVEQTGVDVANNRRIWHKEDVRQLGRIKALTAYGFGLDEVKRIFDGDVDVVTVLEDRLDALRQEEARLHRLILFARFVAATDGDVVDGLLYGSLGMDELADLVRETPEWAKGQTRIEQLDDEELAQMRNDVAPFLDGMLHATVADGFEEVEHCVDGFATWWARDVLAQPGCSFLQLWASFEDGSLAATQVEKAGGEDACATVQSALFYVFMKQLILKTQGAITDIADLADTDAASALPKANELANTIACALGLEDAGALAIPVAMTVLGFTCNLLVDRELLTFLDPERAITLTPVATERTLDALHLLTPD